MSRLKPKSNVWFRMFMSYLLVFAVPFVVFAVFVYYNAIVSLRQEIESANLNKLDQVKDSFDLLVQGLDKTAARMSIDPRLTPYMVRNGSYNSIEAIEELGKYKANNALVDEVLLYFRGDDEIYSSTGKNSMSTFTKSIYGFSDWNGLRLLDDLNDSRRFHIRPAETVTIGNSERASVMTYLFPIPRNAPSPYGTVMFLIRESMFTDRIKPLLGDFRGAVYVMDEKGVTLASRSEGSSLSKMEADEALLQNADAGIHNTVIGGERYSVMVTKSTITGWSYAAIMPTNQFMGRLLKMKTLVLLLCVSVVCIGLAAAAVLSRLQYRPIRSIVEHIRAIQPKHGSPPAGRDEWEMIRKTVDANRDLLQRIDHLRPVAQEQFFQKLLMGHIKSPGDIEAFMASEGISFAGSTFFVAIVTLDSREYVSTKKREEAIRSLPSDGVSSLLGVELIHENAFAIVVNLTDSRESVRVKQERIVADVAEHLERIYPIKPTIGVGNPVRGLVDINRSYIEAMAAADYKIQGRQGFVIFFDEITAWQESEGWYPVEEQVRLVQSIKQGDRDMANAAMSAILADLSGKEMSFFYLKCMCYDLINTVLRTMNELRFELSADNRLALTEFTSLEELGAVMNRLVAGICDHVLASKESKNHALRDAILDYIRQHYREYELNLERIADHFQISISYFSRFLKDQTGLTFTELLTYMRMEEVKRELRCTDKVIKDIVTSVGYIDVPNFMRKFKKAEGLTLGQYRELYGERPHKAL
ncbi:helix-turn-helix domain-containing protein [Paenibacillus sp. HJGM_3]|uniref:helix-turn-helix domain-containing protein n=1 Tax=Paenibacillus sp. HJGM_3 TaxID=3379816 RepID=UPI00385D174F